MRLLQKYSAKINLQRLVVSLCICAVCVATQQMQTAAWNSGLIEFSRDSLGVLMAIIIMTNYKRDHFRKYRIPYLIWSVLGIVFSIVFVPIAIAKRFDYLAADTVIIALGIFLIGYCVIQTFISLVIEKYRPGFFRPLFLIWVVMLILMIFSKSDFLWPECYFVLFLCYYLTEQTPDQRVNVIQGIVDGLILGFLAIQAHSLLCRPYDRLRYYGNFCNPNHNCAFLCICLAGILAKILFITKENKSKVIRAFYFLMVAVCYSFICMTMTRSGYLAVFVVTVFFLIAYSRIRGKMVFFKTGLLLVLLFVGVMPMTYLAVRYIPTIHPHVLFYYQEGYSQSRVHSWDDRNSSKYISFSQMMKGIVGRWESLNVSYDDTDDRTSGLKRSEGQGSLKMAYHGEESPSEIFRFALADTEEGEVNPNKIPVLEKEDGSNTFEVRYTIYHWYFTHLSLRGMPYEEQGFQLTPTHWIQDTHNIYLDYGINFGYPVMILFTIFIWWGIGRLAGRGNRAKNVVQLTCLFLVLIPPVFGLFEYIWGAGTIYTVVFYMAFKEMFSV